MATLFTTTKAFEGLFGVIQTNALTSWAHLNPRPEVIVFGDAPGTAPVAASLGFRHVAHVETNEFGTPLISDIFRQAEAMATTDQLCFVNADIILTDEAMQAADAVAGWSSQFLMVGQRIDLDVTEPIDFGASTWAQEIKHQAERRGHKRSPINIDWFAFARGTWPSIPPFAIGRMAWDNWLIWSASTSGTPVVDATRYARLIHQRHDYSHAGGRQALWSGSEVRRNELLLGHWSRTFSVAHATWMLTERCEVVPARGWKYRLARPRRRASHWLRFTRPVRRRLQRQIPNEIA